MTRKIQFVLILIIFISGIIWYNQYLLLPVALISVVISLKQFIGDHNELKRAQMYCRISKTSSNSSSYRQTVPTLIFAVLYGVSVYLLFQFVPEKHMDNAFSFYVVFPLSIFSASNYYNNFIDSIRSFNDGIKLPGRNATLIPWKKIGMLHLNCNTITCLLYTSPSPRD